MLARPGRAIAWLLAACGLAATAAEHVDAPSAAAARLAQGLIVKLRGAPQADAQRWARLLEEAGVPAHRGRRVGRAARRVEFGRALAADEAERLAERLRRHPDVAWAVPNTLETRLDAASEPLYASQWWLQAAAGSNANVRADRRRGVPGFASAWSISTGSPSAIVAVLDTGRTDHPDLVGRWLPGYDFVSTVEYAGDGDGRDADPSDPGDGVQASDRSANPSLFQNCELDTSTWHGTRIAGMIGANTGNGLGVAGIHWDARILPVRVAGKCGALVEDIVDGMRWAAGLTVDGAPPNPNPARIVNISFGGSAPCNPAYQEAIDDLRAAGAIVVAAAGNRSGSVSRPASCDGVVGVAALNRDGFKATYSSFGEKVVVATVGGDPAELGAWGRWLGDDGLLTTDNNGLYAPGDGVYMPVAGTSFAAPIVSGIASLMLSVNPALTADQLIDGLRRSARPHVVSPKIGPCSAQNNGRCLCTTATCGAGIADAAQALLYARDPRAWVAPARTAEVIDNADVDAAIASGLDRPAEASADRGGGGGGGGGGALSIGWLAALAVAALALRRRPGR